MRRRYLALAFAAAALLAPGLAGQPVHLDAKGGGLGQSLTLTITGPPTAQSLLLMSLTTGPTPLPPPHVPSIDVGIELFNLSLTVFFNPIPPSGTLVYPLPVPNLPILDNLNINFQAYEVQSLVITQKSNLWRVTFDTPGQKAFTLGSLATARAFATATKLNDGTVLVAGGGSGTITTATGLASAELYHPNLEAFSALPPMNSARALHRATLLQDGRVLLTGGVDGAGIPLATAEIFDPAGPSFTAVGNMALARVGHTATLLPDGRVLVAGGSANLTDAITFVTSATATTEIFNPVTLNFSGGPSLNQPKTFHDAAAIPANRVVVSGGLTFALIIGFPIPDISNRAQVYTPNAGAGSFGGTVSMGSKRAAHTSVLLDDGRLLLVGGGSGSVLAPTILASCELLNAAGTAFSATGNLTTARAITGLAKLPDGRVLATGGASGDILNPVPLASCERYDAGTGNWSGEAPMNVSRAGHGTVLLDDLTVGLFAGGGGPSNVSLASAEIAQP